MTDLSPEQRPTNIYDLAQQAVSKNNRRWNADIELFKAGQKRIYITRNNGELSLVLQVLDDENLVQATHQVRCGFLVGMTGWQFWLPRWNYDNWVALCTNGKVTPQARAQGGFLDPESRNYGGYCKRWG